MTKEDTNFLSEIESSSKTKQRELSLSLDKGGFELAKKTLKKQ